MLKVGALSTIVFGAQFDAGIGSNNEGTSFASAMQKTWLNSFTEAREEIFNRASMKKYLVDFGEAYDMIANTDSYKRKRKRQN